jgi:hypothetical protein
MQKLIKNFTVMSCPTRCPSCDSHTVVNDGMGCYCTTCGWEKE